MTPRFRTKLAGILPCIALAGWFHPVGAADLVPTANLDDYQKVVAPLFAKSCADCHGPKKSKAGLRVDQLDPNLLTGRDVDRWVEIYDVLSQSEMPPVDEPDYHLKDEDRARIIEWLGKEMQKASQARRNAGGHSSFRRMANYEYNHALQDMLDLNLQFTEALPPENTSEDGFKNSSKYLQMSATHLENYREIAIEALQKATVEGERPKVVTWQIPMQEAMDKAAALKQKPVLRKTPADARKLWNTHIVNKDTGEGFAYQWTYYVVLDDEAHNGIWNLKPDNVTSATPPVSSVVAVLPPSRQFHLDLGNSIPDEGILRVRIRVGATERQPGQSANLRLVFGFQSNNEGKMSVTVSDRDVEVTASTKNPEFVTFDVPLAGLPRNPFRKIHEVGGSPNCTEYLEIHNISATGKKGQGEPVNLEIDYVEVEAGIYETWPPKSHTAIFFESPNRNDENVYCREILKRFMTRAWRRPIADEDVVPYHKLFSKYRPGFSGFQETMIEVLATVLASPEFLYLVQTKSETASASHTVSDLELANRLSFFLWSSIPDRPLLDLAFAGKLKSPDILNSEIERMLADPKSQRFVRHFVQQWLGFEAMDNLVVDQKKFEFFDEAFKENLLGEPLAFFDHILRNNRSIMDLLHSDYLVINEPLARHYGILAAHFGRHTRHSSLVLSTNAGTGAPRATHTSSFDQQGRPISSINRPKEIFDLLFVTQGRETRDKLVRSKSALDLLIDNVRTLNRKLSSRDRETLEQYLDSVRDTEVNLHKAEQWIDTALPEVDADHLNLEVTVRDSRAYIQTIYELIFLAFLSDSTRVVTYMMGRENTGGPQDLLARAVGLNNAHGLTHDVKKPNGWRNLGTYNRFQAEEFGRFIQKLKDTREPNGNGTLLDNTFAMHGSASSSYHLSRNYPIISAGGKNLGFQNGRYLKFGKGNEDNQAYAGIAEDTVWQKDPDHHELPLAHLFVTILKRMGIETNEFAGYKGALERV